MRGGWNLNNIDLLIGGSPCQGFSNAGKKLNFNDPRSQLFFEYVRILREVKPKYFLLENVKMKKERVDIISTMLWVEPIEINSALVSGQNRKRLYRTNIPGITQPEDKGILLKDVLQDQVDEEYYYSNERRNKILARKYEVTKRLEELNSKCATLVTTGGGDHEKKIAVSHCPASREFDGQGFRTDKVPTLCARDYKDAKVAVELISVQDGEIRVKTATKKWYEVANDGDGINLRYATSTTRRGRVARGESHTLTTQNEADVILIPQTVTVRKYEVDIEGLKAELRKHKNLTNKEIADKLDQPITKVEHRFRNDKCFAIPDANIRFKLKELLGITTTEFDKSITEFIQKPGSYEKAERKILPTWKMTTLTTSQNDDIIVYPRIRKLTPIEYERLQTLPDNYTEGVSKTQRYKMLGNGRTVDVIKHIFSFIPKE